MDWFVRAFIKAGLVWLALGVSLGVGIAVHPAWLVYRPAHLHMNLLGFVTMMIYGVGYHVLPRFSGHPLWNRRLAGWHWGFSNLGLLLMVVGFGMAPNYLPHSTAVLGTGGAISAIGAYLFVLNAWRTLNGPPARPMKLPVSKS